MKADSDKIMSREVIHSENSSSYSFIFIGKREEIDYKKVCSGIERFKKVCKGMMNTQSHDAQAIEAQTRQDTGFCLDALPYIEVEAAC